MADYRDKKRRRQLKASLKNKKAKPSHRGKSGRTGSMHAKKPRARMAPYRFTMPSLKPGQMECWIFEGLR